MNTIYDHLHMRSSCKPTFGIAAKRGYRTDMAQHALSSLTMSDNSFKYFSLPGELRTQIMEDLLVFGDVWVRPSRSPETFSKVWYPGRRMGWALLILTFILGINFSIIPYPYSIISIGPSLILTAVVVVASTREKPARYFVYHSEDLAKQGKEASNDPTRNLTLEGYQFLASCRQAYDEGSSIFFADNRFHLPPGEVRETRAWFDSLREADRAKVRAVALDFTVLDIEPMVTEIIYGVALLMHLFMRYSVSDIWVFGMIYYLEVVWREKLDFVSMKHPNEDCKCNECISWTLERALQNVESRLLEETRRSGVYATKARLTCLDRRMELQYEGFSILGNIPPSQH